LKQVFDLGVQTLTGSFPSSATEEITKGPVELVICAGDNVCNLVQLRQSYDLNEMYGSGYGYRSSLNLSMVRHLNAHVDKILSMGILEDGDLIVDIGSNDGTTLNHYPKSHFSLIGFDPSAEKFKEFYYPHINLVCDFFSSHKLKKLYQSKKAKIVTSFAMFYDLEDPTSFMQEIEDVLHDDGVWIFEQSYLPSMLKTNSFDTICHEHLEFYCLSQIMWMAEKAKLKILDVEFNDVNGGSFVIYAAKVNSALKVNSPKLDRILEEEKDLGVSTLEVWDSFRNNVEQIKQNLLNFLTEAKNNNKTVYGIGASTKGNVLLQYFGVDKNLLKAIGEVNPEKFSKFTPQTHIPLIPEDVALGHSPDYLLILPWHFKQFFINNKKFKGFKLVFPLPKFEIINN
jgi:hypothetical protein